MSISSFRTVTPTYALTNLQIACNGHRGASPLSPATVAVGTRVNLAPPHSPYGQDCCIRLYRRYLALKRIAGRGCRIVALGIHRPQAVRSVPRASTSSGSAVVARGPVPDDLGPKALQTIDVAGHRMVVEVALYNGPNHFPTSATGSCQRRLSSSRTALSFAESRYG